MSRDFKPEPFVEESAPALARRVNGLDLARTLPKQAPYQGPFAPLCRLAAKNACDRYAPAIGALCKFHASAPDTEDEDISARRIARAIDRTWDEYDVNRVSWGEEFASPEERTR